jgi:DNA-directed RNA polymerase specialized sigma24 family protein
MLLEGNDSAKELSDEDLLQRSQSRPWLYAILLERYQDAFMRKARSILRNDLDAEEVVQDTFTKIYMNADKFVPQ